MVMLGKEGKGKKKIRRRGRRTNRSYGSIEWERFRVKSLFIGAIEGDDGMIYFAFFYLQGSRVRKSGEEGNNRANGEGLHFL